MNNNTTIDASFCDLKNFAHTYEDVHGPLSFLVCVFGSVANILNICVLTTKEMRWPTNLILTGLAVADLLVMLDYIPFTFHRYLNQESRKYVYNYTYGWAVFYLFHALFSQVFHFISCCLTVILAIWRYITITNPHNSRVWCSMRNTMYVIVFTYILCPIICVPLFISHKIAEYNQTCDPEGKIIDRKDLGNYTGTVETQVIYYISYISSSNYKYASFWVYGVVLKLFPCILLTHLSWRLISVLVETKRRRKLLLNSSLPLKNVNSSSNANKQCAVNKNKQDKDKQADRTSSMLLAVLLLFLITEFPQAILGLLSAIIGEQFEKQCYVPLGGRIIGGQLAGVDQFPWQVGIFASTETGDIFCGGSLISEQWILTAGHCAVDVYEYQIQLGSNSLGELDDNRVTVYTDQYVQHENFSDFDGIHDDVAVIKLPEPIEFNEHIQPIALHEGEAIEAGVSVTVSGFGKFRDNGTLSNLLNWVELTTVTNEDCSEAYSGEEIGPGFVCATGKSGENTCSGDSGGPLVIYDQDDKAIEVGIVSFGHRDGCSLAPSGYTRVQYYRDWIRDQTGL